jgi:vacuolar-type H+-ATPase subunit H
MSLSTSSPSLLDHIRYKEAEVKRRLAAEREDAEARLAEARRRANELVIAAEAEGRRQGEAEYQAGLAEAEREAAEIVSQARAEADALRVAGQARLEAAVARAVQLIVGGQDAA